MRYVLYDKNTREILLISPKPIKPFGDSQTVATTDIPHNYIYIDIDGTVKELPKSVQESIVISKEKSKRQRYINSLKQYVENIKQKLMSEYFLPVDKTDILRVISNDLELPFEGIYIDFKNEAEKLINYDTVIDESLSKLPKHDLTYLALVQFQYDLLLIQLNKEYLKRLKILKTKPVPDITIDDYRFEFPYTLQL